MNRETKLLGMDNISIRWALCVPSACTAEDVEKHLNKIIPQIVKEMGANATVKVNKLDCQDKSTGPSLYGWDWAVL